MYNKSILIPLSMGDIANKSQIPTVSESTNLSSLKKLVLAAMFSASVSMAAMADDRKLLDAPLLQAIPEYSQNQAGWHELYQAQIDGHGDLASPNYRKWSRKFLILRLADLGYSDPKQAPKSLIPEVISDYNDWQILVWKDKTDKDTDEFLADLVTR